MNRETLSAVSLVKTPLGLFALVLLIVESILGVIALNSNEQLQSYIVIGMLAALFLVVSGVIVLAFLRPRSLYGQPTESKLEIVAAYTPYSQSLMEKAKKQVDVTRKVESSLIQIFPKGTPEGVEHKEWNIIFSLLREQSNLAVSLLETAKQLSELANHNQPCHSDCERTVSPQGA